MTPLITRAVAFFPDIAADYKWFDVADVDNGRMTAHTENMHWIRQPLPFEKCAIAGIDMDGQTYAVLISQEQDGKWLIKAANTLKEYDNRLGQVDPVFRIDPLEEDISDGITIFFEDKRVYKNKTNLAIEVSTISIVAIATFLRNLNNEKIFTAYTPIPSKNHTKRLRQKKLPMFDWHTVVLEPRSTKSEYLGGTHASPRLHDVRGHWVVRGNKRFWRKPHKRGDASKGVIFHDYKLKGDRDDTERNCNFT